jgi:endonuclease/exonuclease/phosphatase family metal-dependent hydrolase
MRVLTYNVHGWRTIEDLPNLSLIAELFERADVDVIGLNEVYHPCPAVTGSALGWLASRLSMSYAFAACWSGRLPRTTIPVSYGNALLSRSPLRAVCSGLFSALPGKEQRGYLEAQIDVADGQTFTVVVTHLDHTDETVRITQLDGLFASGGPLDGTWDLIMGDFNCVHPREYEHRPDAFARVTAHPVAGHLANQPDGPLVTGRMEATGYTDALIHKGLLGKGTFIPAGEPVRLDYIWVSAARLPGLAYAGIVEEPAGREASDHRAVRVELI